MACGGQKGAAVRPKRSRPAEAPASHHRPRGSKEALQLAGQLKGTGHGHGPELAHGHAAAVHEDCEALTAQAEADEWAGAGVGGAAAGSVAAALPTARTGGPAGCCGCRGFAASGVGALLTLSLIDPGRESRTQVTT